MLTTSSPVYDSALLLENILLSVFYCLLFEFKTPVWSATFSELYRQQIMLFYENDESPSACDIVSHYSHALHLTQLCNMSETAVSIVAHDNAQRRCREYVFYGTPVIIIPLSYVSTQCLYSYVCTDIENSVSITHVLVRQYIDIKHYHCVK